MKNIISRTLVALTIILSPAAVHAADSWATTAENVPVSKSGSKPTRRKIIRRVSKKKTTYQRIYGSCQGRYGLNARVIQVRSTGHFKCIRTTLVTYAGNKGRQSGRYGTTSTGEPRGRSVESGRSDRGSYGYSGRSGKSDGFGRTPAPEETIGSLLISMVALLILTFLIFSIFLFILKQLNRSRAGADVQWGRQSKN